MRINKTIAASTGLSRRVADALLSDGRVTVDGRTASIGQSITPGQIVALDGKPLPTNVSAQTVLINKPKGYVVSRNGQGNATVYDLLPPELHHLKPIGRLDKDSSGLLLLTNSGQLAQKLSHPKYEKEKSYQVTLDKPLQPTDKIKIEQGLELPDGLSRLRLDYLQNNVLRVRMSEGKNRQIRRTFAALGYDVKALHRTTFGDYVLPAHQKPGQFTIVKS